MKTHNATSTPAASACQPDMVRSNCAEVDVALFSHVASRVLRGLSEPMQQRVSGAARLVIAGHTIRHCSMAMGVKYGTLSSGVCIAKIRELVTAYQVETGSAKSLAALASSVDVPLVRRLGMKMLANPASILGQNITAIAALSLQGLPVQDIATLFGIKLRTLKKSYLSKSRRICAEYDKVKNPNPEPEKAENTAVYALPRLNGALNAEHEVSMSALWRGLERWRSVA